MGACLGEVLRLHAGAVWKSSENGGVEMELPAGEGVVTAFPFEKIMKQLTVGDRGDLLAFLQTARRLDDVIAQNQKGQT